MSSRASSIDGALDYSPRADSTPGEKEDAGGTPLTVAEGRKRLPPKFLVRPIAAICVVTVGLGLLLIFWITSRKVEKHDCTSSCWESLYVNEGTKGSSGDLVESSRTTGLTIASLIAHVITIITGPLMGVIAYRLAAEWIDAQRGGEQPVASVEPDGNAPGSTALPTPHQYALLLRLCGSCNISSLKETFLYLCTADRPSTSPILIKAFGALTIIVALTHAVGLADLWLHDTTETINYVWSEDLDTTVVGGYATVLNTTRCPGPKSGGAFAAGSNCLVFEDSATGAFGWGQDVMGADLLTEALLTVGNLSTQNTVLLDADEDSLAFIVVSSDQYLGNTTASINFDEAKTFAMNVTCRPVTSACVTANSTDSFSYNCSSIGLPGFAYGPASTATALELSACLSDCDGGAATSLFQTSEIAIGGASPGTNGVIGATSNPFTVTARMIYQFSPDPALTEPEYVTFVVQKQRSMAILLTCDVSVLDVNVSFFGGDYSTNTAMLADTNTASALTGGLAFGYATDAVRGAVALQAAARGANATTYASAFARELARTGLALGAVVVQRADQEGSYAEWRGIVTSYYVPALVVFLVALFANTLFALAVLLWAGLTPSPVIAVGRERVPALVLAHLRLTGPEALVAERFAERRVDTGAAQQSAARSASTKSSGLFKETRNSKSERVALGINAAGTLFGLLDF